MFLFLILSIFIACFNSLVCTEQYQCNSVSTNYNYVTCDNGVCRCLLELGFSGNATSSNKCNCAYGYSVIWDTYPYCIKLIDAVLYKNNKAQEQRQMDAVSLIYNSLVWPRPTIIMPAFLNGTETPESLLFDINCKSRVDPAGEFYGRGLQVEYFYAKVYRPEQIVVQTVFKQLYSSGNRAYTKVDFLFQAIAPDATISYTNVTETSSFTFDPNTGLIVSAYITILNLGAALDKVLPETPGTRFGLCYVILVLAGCNSTHDPLGYYSDMNDCLAYHDSANGGIRWGSFDNFYLDGNNSKCHFDHGDLARGRPFVHCVHAGKTGGGVCTDKPYKTFYDVDYKR